MRDKRNEYRIICANIISNAMRARVIYHCDYPQVSRALVYSYAACATHTHTHIHRYDFTIAINIIALWPRSSLAYTCASNSWAERERERERERARERERVECMCGDAAINCAMRNVAGVVNEWDAPECV